WQDRAVRRRYNPVLIRIHPLLLTFSHRVVPIPPVLPRSRYAILVPPHARTVVQPAEAVARVFLVQRPAARARVVARDTARPRSVGIIAIVVQRIASRPVRLHSRPQTVR